MYDAGMRKNVHSMFIKQRKKEILWKIYSDIVVRVGRTLNGCK